MGEAENARTTGAGTGTPLPLPIIDRLPWEGRPLPGGLALLDRTSASLERFAAALSPSEQSALSALLTLAAGDQPFVELAAEPAERILDAREHDLFLRLAAEPAPPAGLRPSVVLTMKATRLCNLRCTYCHFWREGPDQIMPFPVLARTIRDALRDPGVRHVEFVWHGGEVTLLPLTFYRKVLWLQQQFRRPDQTVANAVQTNGTRLTPEWLAFLKRYQFNVGVSLDGPDEVHDRRRVDVAGRPTAARVREGLHRLRAAGIRHGVLLVIDEDVAAVGADRLLDYLLEIEVNSVGLLNVIPGNTRIEDGPVPAYVPWSAHVAFLQELFHAWWPRYAGRIMLRELADLVGLVNGRPAGTCHFAGDCFGGYLTIEPNGDVSACDKYIEDPEQMFGNVLRAGLSAIGASQRLATVREENAAAVARMADCRWFNVCHGACPHDRRLSEWYEPGFDGRCCGLTPLLDDIAGALATGSPEHEAGRPPV